VGGAFTEHIHEWERAADNGKEIGIRVIGQIKNTLKSLSPSNAILINDAIIQRSQFAAVKMATMRLK
jgi:hypothetical protein